MSVDFLTVHTLTFQLLYVFIVLSHHRHRALHFNVVEEIFGDLDCPTSGSLRLYVIYKILLNDRDRIYSLEFQRCAMALGLEEVRIAPRSPWQSPYVEPLIGSVRHECLDHVIMLKHDHLNRLLENSYARIITGAAPTWPWRKMPQNLARCADRTWERSLRFPKLSNCIIATNAGPPEITSQPLVIWIRGAALPARVIHDA